MRRLLKIVIRGAVQGVGMRPFVARLAGELGVSGWVLNSEEGVFIEAEAEESVLMKFLSRLESEKPRASRIYSLEFSWHDPVGYHGFEIRKSTRSARPTVLVLPDIATCEKCLQELFDPANRRYLYPFINCTDCGPRFSIIEALPYDRPMTTMKVFKMCRDCLAEYEDPTDRRYHAQPNACAVCGPYVWLADRHGREMLRGHAAVSETAVLLSRGMIVAVKGLGGFHLFCDARNPEAVQTLRERKHRYEKPLAVMFPSLKDIRANCFLGREEEMALVSPEAPIVLLRRRKDSEIASGVAPGNPYLGCFLPYTPLHHLLMREARFPCVATSGNLSDEPMAMDNSDALVRLAGIADAFLLHDRGIVRRVDDSVLFIFDSTRIPLRRARGLAPLPVRVKRELPRVLALGGHHKNTIAIAIERNVFIS
ncbi:MAG: carbamoyltransferase HypF, partial [Candidatus Hydrothermia bacterium]